jgi:hypothetical protein
MAKTFYGYCLADAPELGFLPTLAVAMAAGAGAAFVTSPLDLAKVRAAVRLEKGNRCLIDIAAAI